MDDKILNEIKQIKQLLSKLVGTSDLSANQKFSKEAIAKAAKEFQRLSIERGEWLSSDEDIRKLINNAPWRSGKFLIENFSFSNYFKRGKHFFLNKKDLIAISKELKERKINLKKYTELLADKAKFEKYINSINLPGGKKNKKHFKIPEGLRDINSTPYSGTMKELVNKEIETLMAEYEKYNLSEFIDLYQGKTYALFKYDYSFDRYLKPELKKHCKDWCFRYNYAINALKKILDYKAESTM